MATTSYGSPYVSGSDLVAGWPAASLTVANAIDAAGYYIGRGINAQTASYTGVLTDAGKTVTMTVATSNTFTVPLNATVAYPTGTQINILNLGAGACTVTATGGVTISGTISALATNDSATIIKTGTNTWSYLAAPAPGLSLVTPTSVAGSGVTLSGGQVTFTAATTMSVNGCFTATYDNYQFVMTQSASSATNSIYMRLRVAGVDNSSSQYAYGFWDVSGSGSSGAVASNATTQFGLSLSSATNVQTSIFATVTSPFIAQRTNVHQLSYGYDSANYVGRSGVGGVTVTTSYDGFTLFPSAGTFTGTLRVYGLRNS